MSRNGSGVVSGGAAVSGSRRMRWFGRLSDVIRRSLPSCCPGGGGQGQEDPEEEILGSEDGEEEEEEEDSRCYCKGIILQKHN
jgi:hypothetical protein